jgi:hypothetical protein
MAALSLLHNLTHFCIWKGHISSQSSSSAPPVVSPAPVISSIRVTTCTQAYEPQCSQHMPRLLPSRTSHWYLAPREHVTIIHTRSSLRGFGAKRRQVHLIAQAASSTLASSKRSPGQPSYFLDVLWKRKQSSVFSPTKSRNEIILPAALCEGKCGDPVWYWHY